MRREWSMPCSDTFDSPPIAGFVQKYLRHSKLSVDPFARNRRWASHTNDLNPRTAATHHEDALDFLRSLAGTNADLVLFDPPYSPRQLKECYEGIGRAMTKQEAQRSCGWTKERRAIDALLAPGGIVLSFGWHSNGQGKGYALRELLLVAHGGGHNDTICIAEQLDAPDVEFPGWAGGGGRGGSETPPTEKQYNDEAERQEPRQ